MSWKYVADKNLERIECTNSALRYGLYRMQKFSNVSAKTAVVIFMVIVWPCGYFLLGSILLLCFTQS